MLGVYNYTVILTYLGLLSGFFGILAVQNGQIRNALICLMISGACDMFDGKVASTMKRTATEKQFGIQIDSLCDLVCFGVLPAVIVCQSCGHNPIVRAIAALYLLCALIRLAWFNVDEADRQSREDGGRETYVGLPVTTVALILPCLISAGQRSHWPLGIAEPVALLIMSAAFLAPFRIKKPAIVGKIGMLMLGGLGMVLIMISGMDV